MSFLNSNNSESISSRITQKGRNSISRGNFKIEFFQIGDSEFDYNASFSTLTGQTNHQMVMSPFDNESGVKYPYGYDNNISTTYGNPIQASTTETIRNVMGPAGYVGEHINYDPSEGIGSTIFCTTQRIGFSNLIGESTITYTGETFFNCEYITLVLNEFGGTDPDYPIITTKSTSLIFKVVDFVSGTTYNIITLDRPTPNLSTLSGYAQIVSNKCDVEYSSDIDTDLSCLPNQIETTHQQNPWTLNVVWTTKPVGADVTDTDEELSNYNSNRYISIKEFLGYTSTGQTFTNLLGTEISSPTSYNNTYGENILVQPKEQRCVAIIHYSELGDILYDPERFFKYDDFISYNDVIEDSIVTDIYGTDITDTDYFEVYIPFIQYHRSTGTTVGYIFKMDTTNYYVNSTKNPKHNLLFRYLLDEVGNKVGKVFPNNKIVVFDDQELVAILDYRSNRRFTLGSPKVTTSPSDLSSANSLITGLDSQTFWVTYLLSNSDIESPLNYLPCNYFSKIEVNVDDETCSMTNPSNITLKFGETAFQHMNESFGGIVNGFVGKKFKVLIQETTNNTDKLPLSNEWISIDLTSDVTINGSGYIVPSTLTGKTFTITKSLYETNETNKIDLETYMGVDYLWNTIGDPTKPQFGDEQPFPGSIKLVRSSNIEEFNFLVNLPSGEFEETQNPTYISGDKRITEIALLDANKDIMVIAKTSAPIKRIGTQVFSVKLDF